MRKMKGILMALAVFFIMAGAGHAQQLYISSITVGDGGGKWCNSGVVGTARDFIGDVDGNPPTVNSNVWEFSSLIEFERPKNTYPGACLALCVRIDCVVTGSTMSFGIDELSYEIFKFGPGANPLDTASTPPIRTIPLYNIGTCDVSDPNNLGKIIHITHNDGTGNRDFCASWDASYNINGIFSKTNGQYGFRATVKTNQVSPQAGNISISQTTPFPGQNQIPIQVNVTNIHAYRSSPTVVGRITGVAAEPYNIQYRLSKDATTTIKIYTADQAGGLTNGLVKTIVNSMPRVGEGFPDGTLTNGDFWDGRNNQGAMMPPGLYIVQIDARTEDMWAGTDLAWPVTFTIGLDPLQITDVATKPLGASATDMAMVGMMLTEAATVYLDIYQPGTLFTLGGGVNCANRSTACTLATPLKSLSDEKEARKAVSFYWDGRDDSGNLVCDGNYVYALTAAMPGEGGTIWTQKIMTGTLPILRGMPLSFLTPSSTVVGSTPSAAGLDPFYFRYTLIRPADIQLNIRKMDNSFVRNIVNATRSPGITNTEVWDGKDKDGHWVSSGTYSAELIVNDPYQCAIMRSSTHTVQIPLDLFRIVDIKSTPLLGSTTGNASVSFQLTQSMWMDLKIYNPDVIVNPSDWPWESSSPGTPVYSVSGVRPGRFKITEYWDGRDANGLMVADGRYPFTLVAHTTGTATNIMYATDIVYGYVDISRGQIIFTSFDVTPTLPQMYNSSDVVKLPPYEVDYSLNRQSSVTVQIMTMDIPPAVVANVINGEVRDEDIVYKDFWDGRCKDPSPSNTCMNNDYIRGGSYNVRVVARDISTTLTSVTTVQLTIDVFPLRIFDVSIAPLTLDNPAVVSYQVSEPMKVVTKVYKPGTSFDPSGNSYPPESVSLVKRIIGVRPGRTQISEYWDGTDMTLSRVPDGNYVFKVYASTDTNSISSVDGSVKYGTTLADDIVTANIPVVKTAIGNLCDEFERNSFFYPNPYVGTSGKFKIYVPITGRITMKLYNLAGDKVYSYDFGAQSGDTNVELPWAKVNSSGKTVAPGVYIALFRFEATEGAKDMCQMKKKILIP